MVKHLSLQCRMSVDSYGSDRVAVVAFDNRDIEPWTLGLVMLKAQLITELLVSAAHSRRRLRLRRTSDQHLARASMEFGEFDVVVELADTELEHWEYFFLRYVRDGCGSVDHLDLEPDEKATSGGLTITLEVPKSAPALSAEEAARRLGLNVD